MALVSHCPEYVALFKALQLCSPAGTNTLLGDNHLPIAICQGRYWLVHVPGCS